MIDFLACVFIGFLVVALYTIQAALITLLVVFYPYVAFVLLLIAVCAIVGAAIIDV